MVSISFNTIKSGLSTAVGSVSLAIMSASDKLSSLVGRLTGGSVSRDSLAQSTLHGAMQTGTHYLVDWMPEVGGKEMQQLKPFVDQFLMAGTTADVQSSFRGLMNELLPVSNLAGEFWDPILEGVRDDAANLAGVLVGEKGLERTLATLVAQHGREGLTQFLEPMVGGFATRRIMEVLEHSILNKPEYVQPNNSIYGVAADALNFKFLGGDAKPLEDRVVRMLEAAPDSAQSVVSFVRSIVKEGTGPSLLMDLLEKVSQDQSLEKVLATMAQTHGKEHVLGFFNTQVTKLTDDARLGSAIANAVDRAILSKTELVQEQDEKISLLADALHGALTGDFKPLSARVVKLLDTQVLAHPAMRLAGQAANLAGQAATLADNVLMGGRTADLVKAGGQIVNAGMQLVQSAKGAFEFVKIMGNMSSPDSWLGSMVQSPAATPAKEPEAGDSWQEMAQKTLATMADKYDGGEAFKKTLGARVAQIVGSEIIGESVAELVDFFVLSDKSKVDRESWKYGFMAGCVQVAVATEAIPMAQRVVTGTASAAYTAATWGLAAAEKVDAYINPAPVAPTPQAAGG